MFINEEQPLHKLLENLEKQTAEIIRKNNEIFNNKKTKKDKKITNHNKNEDLEELQISETKENINNNNNFHIENKNSQKAKTLKCELNKVNDANKIITTAIKLDNEYYENKNDNKKCFEINNDLVKKPEKFKLWKLNEDNKNIASQLPFEYKAKLNIISNAKYIVNEANNKIKSLRKTEKEHKSFSIEKRNFTSFNKRKLIK